MRRYYVFFAILIPLIFAGSLLQSRLVVSIKLDSKKESDLQTLQQVVDEYSVDEHRLPDDLSTVKSSLTSYNKLQGNMSDYSYQVTSFNKYQLCANFARAHIAPASSTRNNAGGSLTQYHKSGRGCFDFTADSIKQPLPIIVGATPSGSCTVGTRDQKSLLSNVNWVSFDASAKSISVKTVSQEQTLRWCDTPIATDFKGTQIALSAIPTGAKVELAIVAPTTFNANGTGMSGSPYVTSIKEIENVKRK